MTLRVVREEELAFETAAASLEQRLDLHLAATAAQLAALDARLAALSPVSVDDSERRGTGDQ